jgi:methylase of polypeptide subunit release factors
VSTEILITEFVERVREQARSLEPEEIRRALASELRNVARAYARNPADWSAWANGVDVPGDAYEALVSGADRRDAGQFQTPASAADLMAAWLLQEPTELLLDPGVGAGRLLFRAVQRPESSPKRLLGLDVDPVSLEMARVNLLLRGITNCGLRQTNFLVGDLHERPDALICNPPYSRHHAIPATEKEAIHTGFEERLGLRLSRLAGLHVLCLVRALEIIEYGGRLAFITPAEWLDANYGRAVKRFVLDHAQVEALVIWEHDHLFFDGALTTAAITLLRAGAPSSGPTRVVRLPRRQLAVEEVIAAIAGENTRLRVDDVELSAEAKWSRPARRRTPRGTPLKDLARVRRGIATGCNRFFVVSEASRRKNRLNLSHVRPCIATPRLILGDELAVHALECLPDDVPRWVLDCRDPNAERVGPLGRYLRWGKETFGAHTGYLASRRDPWYALERREASPILFTYMNRQHPRFIRNRAGAIPLNTFLIVEPHDGVDADKLWWALNSAHVMRQLAGARRNYGGGLWKLEPRELGNLKVRL